MIRKIGRVDRAKGRGANLERQHLGLAEHVRGIATLAAIADPSGDAAPAFLAVASVKSGARSAADYAAGFDVKYG